MEEQHRCCLQDPLARFAVCAACARCHCRLLWALLPEASIPPLGLHTPQLRRRPRARDGARPAARGQAGGRHICTRVNTVQSNHLALHIFTPAAATAASLSRRCATGCWRRARPAWPLSCCSIRRRAARLTLCRTTSAWTAPTTGSRVRALSHACSRLHAPSSQQPGCRCYCGWLCVRAAFSRRGRRTVYPPAVFPPALIPHIPPPTPAIHPHPGMDTNHFCPGP